MILSKLREIYTTQQSDFFFKNYPGSCAPRVMHYLAFAFNMYKPIETIIEELDYHPNHGTGLDKFYQYLNKYFISFELNYDHFEFAKGNAFSKEVNDLKYLVEFKLEDNIIIANYSDHVDILLGIHSSICEPFYGYNLNNRLYNLKKLNSIIIIPFKETHDHIRTQNFQNTKKYGW